MSSKITPKSLDKLVYSNYEDQANAFQQASPFPHIIIDDFLDLELARSIEQEFPGNDSQDWYSYNNAIEHKKALNNWERF